MSLSPIEFSFPKGSKESSRAHLPRAMASTSSLLLLADHVKLSLLERQRAISLDLEPNSHDGEISRSLDSLRSGIEEIESQPKSVHAFDAVLPCSSNN